MTDTWYMTRTVNRYRRTVTGTDPYGNEITTLTGPVPITGCSWDPRSSEEETNAGRQAVVSGLMWYCTDPNVDVVSSDILEVDGIRYEVDGEVGRYKGARFPQNNHAVAALRRVEG